ncbi:MAG: NAD(P)-dependent oxidoreductase [Patescibacteria group bacterium]
MKLAIFGATGPSGQLLVKQALRAGYNVTVLVRDPAKLGVQNKNLTVIKGNVLNYDDVDKTVKGQDVVLSALGVKPPSREKVVGPATRNIVRAMVSHSVKRLIVESAFFMDESVRKNLFIKLLTVTFMKGLYDDKKIQNEALQKSGLDWTEVRPTMLTNGPKSSYRINVKPGMFSKISRANVADFMLKEIVDGNFKNKSVIITE